MSSNLISPAPAAKPFAWAGGSGRTAPAQWLQEAQSPQRAALLVVLLAILMRFSYLHEALDLLVNLHYMMLVVMPLAILITLISGGLVRSLQSGIGLAFAGYLLWLLPAIVFSSWQGGSFTYVKDYCTYHFPFLLMIGGMLNNRKDLRWFMYTGAIAACIVLVDSRLLGEVDSGGRLTMRGSIGNSNDFAALLLFLTPFLGFAACDKKLIFPLRAMAWVGIAYALYTILSTGSRGALVSILAMGLLIFIQVSFMKKLLILVVFPPLLLVGLSLLSPNTFSRITSIFSTNSVATNAASVEEAQASSAIRRYLLLRSLEFSVSKPLFGVGPGQFSNYEGGTGKVVGGSRGAYNQTHNTLTQFSSEAGIPALLLILASMGTTMFTINRIYKQSRGPRGDEDMASVSFFILLSSLGLIVATQFLSMAQLFYYPAIAGMGIALERVWKRELVLRGARQEQGAGMKPPGGRPDPLRGMAPAAKTMLPASEPAKPRVKFTR